MASASSTGNSEGEAFQRISYQGEGFRPLSSYTVLSLAATVLGRGCNLGEKASFDGEQCPQ